MGEVLVAGDFPDYKLCMVPTLTKRVTFREKCWKMCLFNITYKNKRETKWHEWLGPAWGWHGSSR